MLEDLDLREPVYGESPNFARARLRKVACQVVVGKSRGERGGAPRHVTVSGGDDDVPGRPDPAVSGDAVVVPGRLLDYARIDRSDPLPRLLEAAALAFGSAHSLTTTMSVADPSTSDS